MREVPAKELLASDWTKYQVTVTIRRGDVSLSVNLTVEAESLSEAIEQVFLEYGDLDER